jgi:hypothetical protein
MHCYFRISALHSVGRCILFGVIIRGSLHITLALLSTFRKKEHSLWSDNLRQTLFGDRTYNPALVPKERASRDGYFVKDYKIKTVLFVLYVWC